MKYKNDKFEITGSPAEVSEFLHFARMNDNQDEINAQRQRIKELTLSNTQLRDHQEKLIEHLNRGLRKIGELKEELSRCKEHNCKLQEKFEKAEEENSNLVAESCTLSSEKERYQQLALVREQELRSCKDDLICLQIDYKKWKMEAE